MSLADIPLQQSPTIHAAIFDMDGLMLDSERMALDCWREAAQAVGASITEEAIMGMVGMHINRTIAWLHSQFGEDYPAQAMHAACHKVYMRRTHEAAIPLRPGILEMLDFLEAHQIPKAVATSTTRDLALHHLEKAGLLSRFLFVIGGDEITHPKPAPDIYQAALTRLNQPAHACIVFEDSDFGAQAAHSAGCQLIVVPDLRPPSSDTLALGAPIANSLHHAITLIEDRILHRNKADKK